jgi:hypothetical protein
MADPFLLAHQVGPRFFDLSGKLNPISIREQMVRARLLVERAKQANLIGPTSDLLVVGSGACGATAALHAADLGVPTVLIDRAAGVGGAPAFPLQAGCMTRWIDPTQYDWPMDHWAGGAFPWTGAAMPLPWGEDLADNVAQRWRVNFATACARVAPLLRVLFGARLAWPPAWHDNHVHLLLNHGGADIKVVVGMVIVAIGGGGETTHVTGSAYQGYRFWETDPFENMGSGLGAGKDKVLISGSGDGALQDFLRVATRKPSAKEVYQTCFGPPVPPDLALGIERAIASAEARLRGAFHWGPSGRFDHDVHQELEDEHLKQVAVALADPQVQAHLAALLANRPAELTLVHRCSHLACLFPLNRFLVLLIAEYLKANNVIVHRPGQSVDRILPAPPHAACTGTAACHGQDHDVHLVQFPRCWDLAGPPVPAPIRANVVIIRHGIERASIPWLSLTPLANYRQILPTHLH